MIGSILGHPVKRVEDRGFLTGEARYAEDLPCEGALHAVFVRSTVAHARVVSVDVAEAVAMPGVAGVFVHADLGLGPKKGPGTAPAMVRPVLADGVVRFVGEPVAVVLAETREQATDAAEAVVVDFDPLPVVVDPDAALAQNAPLLFPSAGTNIAADREFRPEEPDEEDDEDDPSDEGSEGGGESGMAEGGDPTSYIRWDDALEGAEVVVRGRFVNQRVAPVPMEPNGLVAAPDPATGGLTVWAPCQGPFSVRKEIARALRLGEEQVHVIAPAVGGGFGAKFDTYPEQLVVAALALRLGRPVRYVESRSDNLTAMTHGRNQIQEVELGATREGVITGLRVRIVADMGAYPVGTFLPTLTRLMASGVYAIPRIAVRAVSPVTNTTPVAAYRGAGRPEAAAMVERIVDQLADELDLDPVDVRRRNFIEAGAFPYTTPTGAVYDSGAYEGAMDRALEVARYEDLRTEQAKRRAAGDQWQLGIGVTTYVEVTGYGSEFGSVEVGEDGSATVLTGLSPHGQGHETALAQLVSASLGIPFELVRVVHSDTAVLPRGEGTAGSRSLQIGGTAVYQAGEKVVEKARRVAAFLLETAVEDVELVAEEGRLGVVGAPQRSLSWAEVAAVAGDPARLPEGMEPGLVGESDFEQPGDGSTYPFGCHVAVVEVDVETGFVRPVKHVAVDDCGRILNPMLVDGQVHGGVGQGVAQALFEEVEYDPEGNPLTGSLLTYAMPSAADLGPVETAHTETPSPLNPLGAKGIGESGTIGSTPAVQNAVVDAVSHLGVRHIDMPLTPERVWRAIRESPGSS